MANYEKLQYVLSLIEEAIEDKKTIGETSRKYDLGDMYVSNFMAEIKSKRKPSCTFPDEDSLEIRSKWNEYLKLNNKSTHSLTDNRIITKNKVKVKIKSKEETEEQQQK